MPSDYREQYERLRRWYAKLAKLHGGREHDVASDNYVDEIYAFFMNCYHLKDWIRKDAAVPAAVRDAVEDYIDANRALRLCADICNSLKHVTLTKPRSGESPSFGRKRYRFALGSGAPRIGLTYEIDASGGKTDAFTLAGECIAAWDAFLALHGLSDPAPVVGPLSRRKPWLVCLMGVRRERRTLKLDPPA